MKMNKNLIFWMIIFVFAFSSIIAYSGMTIGGNEDTKLIISEEEKRKMTEEKITQDTGVQSIEGIVRKMESGTYQETDYYLEVGGITLSLLKSEKENLSRYIGKNVKIWGQPYQNTEGDGIIIDVERVELSQQ